MAWVRKSGPLTIGLIAGLVVGGLGVMGGMEHNGWMSPAEAQKMALRQTTEAVAAEVAPYCVDRFIHLPDASKQLKSLRDAPGNEGVDVIRRLGLARAPGAASDSPFASDIASVCAERVRALTEVYEAKGQTSFMQLLETVVFHIVDHIVDYIAPPLLRGIVGLLAL